MVDTGEETSQEEACEIRGRSVLHLWRGETATELEEMLLGVLIGAERIKGISCSFRYIFDSGLQAPLVIEILCPSVSELVLRAGCGP